MTRFVKHSVPQKGMELLVKHEPAKIRQTLIFGIWQLSVKAKSSPPANESGLIPYSSENRGIGCSQGWRCSVNSKVNLLAKMNGSQGRTRDEVGVVSGDARNATCWGNPKQKQSWGVRIRKEAWIKQGINNPVKEPRATCVVSACGNSVFELVHKDFAPPLGGNIVMNCNI